ncbi:hypothetical protein RHGRI_010302 [Rhododendron griersonianum]|nr:hypothetical protein RHGRI_010302 [Rhododendron griersonianum]
MIATETSTNRKGVNEGKRRRAVPQGQQAPRVGGLATKDEHLNLPIMDAISYYSIILDKGGEKPTSRQFNSMLSNYFFADILNIISTSVVLISEMASQYHVRAKTTIPKL